MGKKTAEECDTDGYRFFLFSKLWDVYKCTEGLEYDLMYPIVQNVFEDYLNSKYDDPEINEYECMERFLKDYKDDSMDKVCKNCKYQNRQGSCPLYSLYHGHGWISDDLMVSCVEFEYKELI